MVMIAGREMMGQMDDRSEGDQGNGMGNRARQAHDKWMQEAFSFTGQIDQHICYERAVSDDLQISWNSNPFLGTYLPVRCIAAPVVLEARSGIPGSLDDLYCFAGRAAITGQGRGMRGCS